MTTFAPAGQRRRCAVVYNPTKISDQFCALLEDRLLRMGWVDTLWLETSSEDPGRAMTQQAVAEDVDLVIGAGGDGTVRIVADGLAHTGTPMGLIPAGTANLLARNLDLPLEDAISISHWRKGPRSRSPLAATHAPSTWSRSLSMIDRRNTSQ